MTFKQRIVGFGAAVAALAAIDTGVCASRHGRQNAGHLRARLLVGHRPSDHRRRPFPVHRRRRPAGRHPGTQDSVAARLHWRHLGGRGAASVPPEYALCRGRHCCQHSADGGCGHRQLCAYRRRCLRGSSASPASSTATPMRESIFGAEPTPLYAYLAGFAIIQFVDRLCRGIGVRTAAEAFRHTGIASAARCRRRHGWRRAWSRSAPCCFRSLVSKPAAGGVPSAALIVARAVVTCEVIVQCSIPPKSR